MAKFILKQKGLGKKVKQMTKHTPQHNLYFLLLASLIMQVISPHDQAHQATTTFCSPIQRATTRTGGDTRAAFPGPVANGGRPTLPPEPPAHREPLPGPSPVAPPGAAHNGGPGPAERNGTERRRAFRAFPTHLCRETHIAGSHFHDFVASGISWIRGRFIRTPCGCEEVSSQGQCGVNYTLSTPPLLIAEYKKIQKGRKKLQVKYVNEQFTATKRFTDFPISCLRRCVPFNAVLL